MKALIITLCISLLFVSCAPAPPAFTSDPCKDPQYLQLKKKDLNTMTMREYDYFRQKDDECQQWKIYTDAQKRFETTMRNVTIASVAIGLFSGLLYLALSK